MPNTLQRRKEEYSILLLCILINSMYALVLSSDSPDFESYVMRHNEVSEYSWKILNWNEYYFLKIVDIIFQFNNDSIYKIYLYIIILTVLKLYILIYTFTHIPFKIQKIFVISLLLFLLVPKNLLTILSIYPMGLALVCAFCCLIVITSYVFEFGSKISLPFLSILLTLIFMTRIDILGFMTIALILIFIYNYLFISQNNLKIFILMILSTLYFLFSFFFFKTSKLFIEDGVKGQIVISDGKELDAGIAITETLFQKDNIIQVTLKIFLKSIFQLSGIIDQFFTGNTSGALARVFAISFLVIVILGLIIIVLRNRDILFFKFQSKHIFLISWLFISYSILNFMTKEISVKVVYLAPHILLALISFLLFTYKASTVMFKFLSQIFIVVNVFNIIFVTFLNTINNSYSIARIFLNILLIILFWYIYRIILKKVKLLIFSETVQVK
jgi:hypothetical protein